MDRFRCPGKTKQLRTLGTSVAFSNSKIIQKMIYIFMQKFNRRKPYSLNTLSSKHLGNLVEISRDVTRRDIKNVTCGSSKDACAKKPSCSFG